MENQNNNVSTNQSQTTLGAGEIPTPPLPVLEGKPLVTKKSEIPIISYVISGVLFLVTLQKFSTLQEKLGFTALGLLIIGMLWFWDNAKKPGGFLERRGSGKFPQE